MLRVQILDMPQCIWLKILRNGMLQAFAEVDVRTSGSSLKILDAQRQPHRVGFQLGNIEQVAIRIVERTHVLRAPEDHTIRAFLGGWSP